MISASQATDADAPGALKPLTAPAGKAELRLTEQRVPRHWLDRLSSSMGRPVGVSAVLNSADHTLGDASACTSSERKALPVAPAATRAYCWDRADTEGWRAGAVTTSGDADDDGAWGKNRVILSGWTRAAGSADQGLARVAFVDANSRDHLRYTWVLLAVPVDGGRDYRGLDSPVSGMVWYQDKLLVTAGRGDHHALYVYDMNRVQRATVDAASVGRVRGGWSANGSRYVLPAVASYRLNGDGAPHPDAISLDRSTAPDSLVASGRVPSGGDRHTRLWRYAFSKDPARSGLLAVDAAGHADAVEAYETKATNVRGVLSYRSAWYLGRAVGDQDGRGTLWRQDTRGARATHCGTDDTHRCWSGRAESFSYWTQTGEVWSQSGQVLFALPLKSIDRSLD
jgi:hypothetical protein